MTVLRWVIGYTSLSAMNVWDRMPCLCTLTKAYHQKHLCLVSNNLGKCYFENIASSF